MDDDLRERLIEKEKNNLFRYLLPFGYQDVNVAIETALDVGEDGEWAGEKIQEYCDNVGCQIKDVDCVSIIYDSIFQDCRNEIIEHTGKDICNDLKEQVEVYGNYMCSSYDGSEDAVKETLELAKMIPEDERSEKIKWFIEQLEDMY